MLVQTSKPFCSFSNLITLYFRKYRSIFIINFTISGVFVENFMDGLTHQLQDRDSWQSLWQFRITQGVPFTIAPVYGCVHRPGQPEPSWVIL